MLGGDTRSLRVPGVGECRVCDITAAHCSERIDERIDEAQRVEVVGTGLF